MKRLVLFVAVLSAIPSFLAFAAGDGYTVSGHVIDRVTRDGVPYAAVVIVGVEGSGAVADSTGYFTLTDVTPGIVRFSAIQLGYRTTVTPEYKITPYTPLIEIEMDQESTEITASSVRPSPFLRSVESPVSVRIISVGDIDRIPGANKDIARIVRSYPGVSYSPIGYRNDLIVRGGGPSENAFYIDGIEIPNINHFATQGASGGPVSILDSDLIREINFYTGSFPANRGGALSSVMDITLKDGIPDKHSFKATVGASEVGVNARGHIGDKTTYVASVRQSYLQLLFKLLGLPLLPNYIDALAKFKVKPDRQNEFSVVALAGFDNMKLSDSPDDPGDEYLLSYLPKLKQETFTIGTSYRHFGDGHVQTYVLSYNYLNNRSMKYMNNDDSDPGSLMLRSSSLEGKAQFRFENRSYYGSWTVREGGVADWRHYDAAVYKRTTDNAYVSNDTYLGFLEYALFASADYRSPSSKVNASFGLRLDGSTFSSATAAFWKQFSPRASVSYMPWDSWSFNASAAIYHQLPPLTALSYRDADGNPVNGNLDYMRVASFAAGADWRLRDRLFIGLESFYKHFLDIPLSVATGVPLTCTGADYGSIGEEPLVSSAIGRSYGLELIVRWLIPDKITLIGSATVYASEYKADKESSYIPSAWDNRFILNLSAVYDLPHYWSLGMKVSAIGGAPYTPYDEVVSSYKTVWDAGGRPVYDYDRYNQKRLSPYYQVDLRVDKNFYFRKWTLGLYVDLQNVTFSKIRQPDAYLSTGEIINPDALPSEQRYALEVLELWSGTIVPAIGVTVEF